MGALVTSLRIDSERFLEMTIEAVEGDFPLLIGLEIMKKHRLILKYGNDRMSDNSGTWTLPITHAHGHFFVQDEAYEILYTKPELETLHLQFHHQSTGKLYNLLKRFDPDNTDTSAKATLEEISKACASCSELHSSPFRFRAALPQDELIFNHELTIELMWLDRSLVLHIVDTHKITIMQNSYRTSRQIHSGKHSSVYG